MQAWIDLTIAGYSRMSHSTAEMRRTGDKDAAIRQGGDAGAEHVVTSLGHEALGHGVGRWIQRRGERLTCAHRQGRESEFVGGASGSAGVKSNDVTMSM